MQNDPISPQLARRMMLWKLVFSRSQGGTTCTASPNKYGSRLIDTCVVGRAWSISRGRARSFVRGQACVVVRGRSCVSGRARSFVVVCGRAPSRPTLSSIPILIG